MVFWTSLWSHLATRKRALAARLRGYANEQDLIAARSSIISFSFDRALEQVAGVAPLQGREASIVDARLAIKASHFSCGPVARAAESHLRVAGVTGVEFHFLGGHYVLLDRLTGRFYDLETPQGCYRKQEFRLWYRTDEMMRRPDDKAFEDEVFERCALSWLQGRKSAAHSLSAESK